MRSLPLLTLLLAACGGPDTTGMLECPASGFRSIHTAVTDCATIQSRIDFAHWLIVDSDTATEEEWAKALKGTDLVVIGTAAFDSQGTRVDGTQNWGFIELGSGLEALAHEVLHVVEFNRGDLLTGEHFNWKINGAYAIHDHFSWSVDGEKRPFVRCDVTPFTAVQIAALTKHGIDVVAWDEQLAALPRSSHCP